MLTGDLKRRNTVKARRLLRKLCTRRAAGGQSLQNRQHCTLGPLGLYEIFSVHFPKFLGRYVFLFFVLFCFVLLRNIVQIVGIVRVAALYSSEKHHSLLHHPCDECSLECTTYCSLLLCEGLLTLSL